MRLRNLLLPILLIVIASASFFYYTKPAYDGTKDTTVQITEYERALSQVQETQQLRDDLLGRFNQISEQQSYTMSQILPTEFDQVRFLIELDRLAAQSGLTLQNVSFSSAAAGEQAADGAGQTESGVQTTEVSFSTTASYDDALVLARNIERSAQIIDITELSVGAPGGGDGEGEAPEQTLLIGNQNTYNFTGTTYWMPEQTQN